MTRTAPLLAGLAAALALAACGSNNDNNSGSGAQTGADKAFDGALKFARCMRGHGLDFPDPKRNGNKITIGGGPGKARFGPGANAKMQAAQKDCEKYLNVGGGPPMDAATRAKAQDALVQYATCMRGQGIDMPDPKVGPNGGVLVRRKAPQGGSDKGTDTGGPLPDSPAFKAADKVCHSKLAELEKIMPRKGGQ